MRKRNYREKSVLCSIIPAIIILGVVAGLILYGLNDASGAVDSEGLRIAEDSVRRAAVTCYSVEGRYPDTYEYLKTNYGLAVDESRYVVHYEVFASNIMPSVTVVRR